MTVILDDDDLYIFLLELHMLIQAGDTKTAMLELKELLKGTKYEAL